MGLEHLAVDLVDSSFLSSCSFPSYVSSCGTESNGVSLARQSEPRTDERSGGCWTRPTGGLRSWVSIMVKRDGLRDNFHTPICSVKDCEYLDVAVA
jgi:hypothetical protein